MSWSWGDVGNNNCSTHYYVYVTLLSVTIMTDVDIIDCQYQGFVLVIIIMDSKLTLHLSMPSYNNNIIMSVNI